MISIEQVRAARALLGWSQQDLSKRCGISKVTIGKLESGASNAHSNTLDSIVETFQQHSVEFIENGVRIRDELVQVFEGDDSFLRVMNLAYSTLRKTQGELLISHSDERKSSPEVIEIARRIDTTGRRVRIINEEGNNFILGPLQDYRQMPSKYFTNHVVVIFGDIVAFDIYDGFVSRSLVINNRAVAEAQRGIFELIWSTGKKPTKTTAKYSLADEVPASQVAHPDHVEYWKKSVLPNYERVTELDGSKKGL